MMHELARHFAWAAMTLPLATAIAHAQTAAKPEEPGTNS
jgi:hypothetical protein